MADDKTTAAPAATAPAKPKRARTARSAAAPAAAPAATAPVAAAAPATEVTVKFRDHKGEATERTFSKDVHGDDFAKAAEEFKTTNASKLITEDAA